MTAVRSGGGSARSGSGNARRRPGSRLPRLSASIRSLKFKSGEAA